MSLYANPALYAAFFAPTAEMRDSVTRVLGIHLGDRRGAIRRVLDPACGPGLWLEHFAERGAEVCGIELDERAAAAARARLGAMGVIAHGDMRAPPPTIRGPFDVIINLDNSIGHLGGTADIVAHLRAMRECLAPNGVFLLGCGIRELDEPVAPRTIYERGPWPIATGGVAAIRSETLGLSKDNAPRGLRCERIRHHVLTTHVPGLPPYFIDQYDLLVFPFATFKKALAASGPWEVLDCRNASDESWPPRRFAKGCGDVMLALRRAQRDA